MRLFAILMDGDDAGERCATSIFAEVASRRRVRWAKLHEGKQPTDCKIKERPFGRSFHFQVRKKSIDQRLIDAWTGHQTDAMRRRYTHLFPEPQQKPCSSCSENKQSSSGTSFCAAFLWRRKQPFSAVARYLFIRDSPLLRFRKPPA
jgi:hypothetical protein